MRGTLHRGTTEITETYHGQAAEVENFCEHISLEDLEKSEPARGTKRSVLLDERTVTGEFRANNGRMSYAQLYRALQAERFAMEPCPQAQTQPNADQRRLYIHNITPHIAAVLMATTSVHEAPAVRDLLYLHLARGTETRVSIPVSSSAGNHASKVRPGLTSSYLVSWFPNVHAHP
ncbi:hypothetical protein GQ53DRAFT_83054 [Thozetella sp. PMI_491]|nr:hypothetical protein GQ53DRAFT_83054 [Thozetella sp. PMI_491]